MFNWDAIGAVGEIIGALAVVVTLLVLVREMRTNTNTIRLQSGREVAFGLSDWHREIVKDPELMRIFLKSTQSPIADYTDEEWNKFNFLAKTLEGVWVGQTSIDEAMEKIQEQWQEGLDKG